MRINHHMHEHTSASTPMCIDAHTHTHGKKIPHSQVRAKIKGNKIEQVSIVEGCF